ncbi:MAG: cyclase family protein [Desulfosarcinaceae bacterium]|nr:cyclase family protein [Desulfosarcinaceae bacterium]
MPLIDLTHPIHPDMPVYPGTEPPTIAQACRIEREGFAEKLLTCYSHTGTHMDAPSHLIAGGRHLDSYPVDSFVGAGCCLRVDAADGDVISVGHLETQAQVLRQAAFIFLHTGWGNRWGTPAYFEPHPVLSPAAAVWLADLPMKAIGVDAISVDRLDTQSYPVHIALLSRDILIIENLCRLEQLPVSGFQVTCLPLPLTEADGAPVRVVARL